MSNRDFNTSSSADGIGEFTAVVLGLIAAAAAVCWWLL